MIYSSDLVGEAVALGITHPTLGQAIVVAAAAKVGETLDTSEIINYCRRELPTFMIPSHIAEFDALPRNPNGKIDRNSLNQQLSGMFEDNPA